MESKEAKGTKPLGTGAEKLPKANPKGSKALREQSAIQSVVIGPRRLQTASLL